MSTCNRVARDSGPLPPWRRALVVVVATHALAVPAPAQDIRVDVTGSNIPRTHTEGPANLEVVTRADIERTGATTMNELMAYLPSIDFYQSELNSNSPTGSGTAALRLRGFLDVDVLVLL